MELAYAIVQWLALGVSLELSARTVLPITTSQQLVPPVRPSSLVPVIDPCLGSDIVPPK
eukprot:SM001451S01066  [mRNA]  locus=s1451:1:330:- [translate_table: standard]